MIRLLRANYARLWKTRSFWICLITAVALGISNLISDRAAYTQRAGSMMLQNGLNVVFFAAIFASLYLGTDHSNGTIRNKMMIGHTRAEIYLANLITTVSGSIILLAASLLTSLVITLCLNGNLGMPAGEFALKMAVCLCALIAICAIFTVLGMVIASKSTIITLTLVLTFAFVIVATMLESLLAEPEYVSGYEMSLNGEFIQTDPEPNPLYVSGVKRSIFSAVNDILPCGQLVQIELGVCRNATLMPLYSLGVFVVSTIAGAVVFRKKDLK